MKPLYRIESQQVTANVLDDEVVLVHLETTHYYNLNAAGTLVWNLLARGPASLDEAVREVASAYELEETRVHGDVEKLLAELLAERLIRVAS